VPETERLQKDMLAAALTGFAFCGIHESHCVHCVAKRVAVPELVNFEIMSIDIG
jgi:hypothetical protein